MKIRRGFVSNSSSSSFLVNNLEILSEDLITYIKLTPSQIEAISQDKPEILNLGDDVYLTQYISDGGDTYYKMMYELPEICIPCVDGDHGFPYGVEHYDALTASDDVGNKYSRDCFILKKHNNGVESEN